MRIILAPNAFKGSMDGIEAARAMRQGIRRVSDHIEIECVPVSDGGDGLLEVLASALDGSIVDYTVTGPLFDKVSAPLCIVKQSRLAIIEMARASGLVLVSEQRRNPENTTTFGTGQLILRSLDHDTERLVVGIGGSATCDGGIGAAAAVGYRFLDRTGRELDPIGANLHRICSIATDRVDSRLHSVSVEAICDVVNPLTGPNGASYVYSPQKGADDKQVKRLDDGLKNLAAVIGRDLGVEVEQLPGAGAAGGLGGGLYAFFGARLKKGIDLVMDIVGLAEKVRGADLVFTGEGQMDFQTKFDKAPAGVARIARQEGVSCIAICGSIGEGIQDLHEIGVDAVFSLCDGPQTLAHAIANGPDLLANTTEQAMRLVYRMIK